MKMYDPYYLIDPTEKPTYRIENLGRTSGGRFASVMMHDELNDESFPIESKAWSRPAISNRAILDELRGEDFRYAVLPDESIFSWRMICEMYEAARDALAAGKSDEDAIAAAHKYLADKQYDAARTHLERLLGDIKDGNAIDMSETISNWMSENWDVIPEVEL